MDPIQRDLALRTIPVLESQDVKGLYLRISNYFSTKVGDSVTASEELGIIMMSKLRGTYAQIAAQKNCKTYADITSKVVR